MGTIYSRLQLPGLENDEAEQLNFQGKTRQDQGDSLTGDGDIEC